MATLETRRLGKLRSLRDGSWRLWVPHPRGTDYSARPLGGSEGYSPSTLAVHIAALVCAAEFFADRGDDITAAFVRDYADFLEAHIEGWTVTTEGTLVPGITRHYIRVNPSSAVDGSDENPNHGTLVLANQPPGARVEFPAKEIVDAGFLELVRVGIRSAHDPTHSGFAARGRCCAQSGHAVWTLLASLQP